MRRLYRMIAVLAAIAAVVVGCYGAYRYMGEKNAGNEYEEIREEAVKEPEESEAKAQDEPQKEQPEEKQEKAQETKEPVGIPIDFEELQKRNPDVYARIQIPGTSVDDPIVQREEDNTYYLTHDINNEENISGAIFTENYNHKDFEDPNTLIYGHDMKNGSMFQGLHQYMDRSFFDENRAVTIYLPDRILHYKIFAAYLYDNRHILMSFDFNDKEVYKRYLEEIFSMRDMNSFVDDSIKVNNENKIITMSTCYAGDSSHRYLVQAVLESVEK